MYTCTCRAAATRLPDQKSTHGSLRGGFYKNSIANFFAIESLKKIKEKYKEYSWLDRGSDERQYCSPNIGLDFASLMTAKYGEYKEYHNSLDKLGTTVTSKGLLRGYKLIKNLVS